MIPAEVDATEQARDERDRLNRRIQSFGRLLDAAERGGATVMRIDDIRRALKIGAHR